MKLVGFPDVIACQAFENCERILFGLKKFLEGSIEKLPTLGDSFINMDSPIVIPWTAYHKRKRETKWRTWLNEYVYADNRLEDSVLKRFQCFQYFCKAGLIPFVNDHKYVFNPNYDLANELANYLYYGRDVFERIQPFYRKIGGRVKMNVDYDYYSTRGIPDEDWTLFWNDWQWMTDFYDENFRNRFLIPGFVYSRLYLEISEATRVVSEELEGDEDGEDYHSSIEQASDAIGQGKDKNSLY